MIPERRHAMTTYEELAEALQEQMHVKIGHNTYAHRAGPDLITVTLHGHTILTFSSAGSIGASDAGWVTSTTVDRLNRFTPDRFVFARSMGVTYVMDTQDDSLRKVPLAAVECLLPDADRGAGLVINLREKS
jgi:hypothetical protein